MRQNLARLSQKLAQFAQDAKSAPFRKKALLKKLFLNTVIKTQPTEPAMPKRKAARSTEPTLAHATPADSAPAYDTPWKLALEHYFPQFMAFYFPTTCAAIDWTKGYTFLDKELSKVIKDALVGTRHVDKLVKVYRKTGEEDWLGMHIEVQSSRSSDFSRRMYQYHYKIYDRYAKPAESMALLCDDEDDWQPNQFHYQVVHCKLTFDFPTTKLASFAGREAELAKDENPFAWLTLAWLQFRTAKHDKRVQLDVKFNLIRALFRKQWAKPQIREFLQIMDWMTTLPVELNSQLDDMVGTLESEQNMEYIDSITRLRMARGEATARQQGMASLLVKLLKSRFQSLPDWVGSQLGQATQADIERWAERVLTAPTLEAVFANETH
jgi:hypothetical protein